MRSADAPSEGPISRQSVSKHLAFLVEAGLVHTRDVRGDRGDTVEFSLNHRAIYALAEEVRDLAKLRPSVEPSDATVHHAGTSARKLPAPSLVIVKGLDEGAAFDLAPRPPTRVEWTIGRRRGVEVALDFDPFVSSENSIIRWVRGRHHLEALPGSRNGTLVNFERLAPGEPRALRHGDLLSVGRTTLTYWDPDA